MKKQTVKINEAQLSKIVAESVKKVLNENIEPNNYYKQAAQILNTKLGQVEESWVNEVNSQYGYEISNALMKVINSVCSDYLTRF